MTKVDKAYLVQCFYMEADKTVSREIEVSEVTSVFRTQVVPMPVCRYEILEESALGKPVRFVVIGQKVYHKWTCQSDTTDTFCMKVHFCFVSDGSGNNVDLVDPNGCALDKYLLGNLEYTTDLMAGKEAHVFKFADVPALFFQCQIAISIKELGELCPLQKCENPERGKRTTNSENFVGFVDVTSQNLFALDIEENYSDKILEINNAPLVKPVETCLPISKILFWFLSLVSLLFAPFSMFVVWVAKQLYKKFK